MPLSHNSWTTIAYSGLWGVVVVWLLWLSGRALAAQARGVLGLTPSDCWAFLYFCLITFTTVIFLVASSCMPVKHTRLGWSGDMVAFLENYLHLNALRPVITSEAILGQN